MNISRRGFLSGIIAAGVAPATVRVASIMPVKVMPRDEDLYELMRRKMREHDDAMLDELTSEIFMKNGTVGGIDRTTHSWWRNTAPSINPGNIKSEPFRWTAMSTPIFVKRAS